MVITDLQYLENLATDDLIFGSVGVSVTSAASASGSPTYTFAGANVISRSLRNGGGIAIGSGSALAVGDDPNAYVIVTGDGDIVIGKTKFLKFNDIAFARGWVIAIDLPKRLLN
ncbi:hypothetical protein [Nostoc sp. UHCC 0870]|uniref:hypothetical protein n=1 Tax=Nostoc sp. UHCC 0870 TaxID=2914041 RepID=UPI001EDDD43D|nr:hypothetical protein [Nostoc sp. UHCC 0870]UKO97446.1 hypothetical protein L6494_23185 [Nostoc sp. UHCC 0870]